MGRGRGWGFPKFSAADLSPRLGAGSNMPFAHGFYVALNHSYTHKIAPGEKTGEANRKPAEVLPSATME